jgi:hypothetical protein
MQSFLARCVALALIAGGFALTGDVARLVDRGRRVIEGRSTRSAAPTRAAAADAPEPPAPPPASAAPGGQSPAGSAAAEPATVAEAAPSAPRPRNPAADAPVGRRVAVPAAPADGPATVDPRSLAVGDRVLVWLRPESRGARGGDMVALDVIEPGSAEALLHRHAALAFADRSAVQAAPRRVVIGDSTGGSIARGARLRLTPVHGLNGRGTAEDLGTVAAIDVVRQAN